MGTVLSDAHMGVTKVHGQGRPMRGGEPDSNMYLQYSLSVIPSTISPLRNQLGDTAVVLIGVASQFNGRQRRLKWYFDGQQAHNGRDHSREGHRRRLGGRFERDGSTQLKGDFYALMIRCPGTI